MGVTTLVTDPTPQLIIVSGPSGAGKSTVVRHLLDHCPLPIELSVSATTRKPREGEEHGVHYWFFDQEEFSDRRERGEFLECMEVFGRGHWYGTLKSTVTTGLNEGKWVLLEIDVNGAMAVLDQFPNAITFFIHPGSLEELEKRLRNRGSETESSLKRRLEVAKAELEIAPRYRYTIVNHVPHRAAEDICRHLMSVGEE